MKKDIVVTWECKECGTDCKLTFNESYKLIDEFPPVNCPFVPDTETPRIKPVWNLLHSIQVV